MILVTLGTQDKDFSRLLFAIEKQIVKGNIKEKVIVQSGFTKFHSEHMHIVDFMSSEELDDLISSCDILITHGGVGSIVAALKNNKKIIAAARLKKYKEHTNDHQKQIIEKFAKEGYLLELKDFDKLDKVLTKINRFKPQKFHSNTSHMISLIENQIDEWLK